MLDYSGPKLIQLWDPLGRVSFPEEAKRISEGSSQKSISACRECILEFDEYSQNTTHRRLKLHHFHRP